MFEVLLNGDGRGYLVIVEGMQDIPFEIKRIFYICGISNHCHKYRYKEDRKVGK